MKRTPFIRRPIEWPTGPDRSAEFASWVPTPRPVAPASGVALALAGVLNEPPRLATAKTAAEAAYMGRVADVGCIVCRLLGVPQSSHTEVHHARAGAGMAQRGGHFLTIPLCGECHRGRYGVHGDRACLRQLNMTELDLLNETLREMFA